MALAFVMTLCLLVYKLAEVRLRQRLAATGQTVPDQKGKPTARPTLRWLFQCFEGIDLHHTRQSNGVDETEVLRLTRVHRLVLHLLGPAYENVLFDLPGNCGMRAIRLFGGSVDGLIVEPRIQGLLHPPL